MTDITNAAHDAELDQALKLGIHQVVMDATGRPVDRAALPVGRVPSGQSLVDFWHLNFPLGAMDYHAPEVQLLLNDMLSVRRLDSGALQALMARIKDRLVKAYGPQQGSLMAGMLIARCQQALQQPEDFPPLLSDQELVAAYKVATRSRDAFGFLGGATGAFAGVPGLAQKAAAASWPPSWLSRILTRLAAIPEAAAPVFGWSTKWAAFMFATGNRHFSSRAQEYRDEINRRNLSLP
ncbi:hypothetical protein [Nitrospirillum sp. BR 11163]|uniref:hypothetical protein n=1 Tax=Nitrospirillum sp. BR 11163 TaxID=3104323 RepID=UPI002AFE5263|nr:hypothetical protein [Nitrospirillum sp. BR 11163]MEA1675467.1 hypothetical protein [Nitrospirillum sp. BR 11163]